MKLRRVAILLSVLLCLSTAPAFARTLVVDNDGAECPQAEYNTIQQAVAAAQAGDKILVCPGLYFGTVVVNTPDLRIEAQAAPGGRETPETSCDPVSSSPPGARDVVLQGTGAPGELGFHLLNTTGVVLQGFTVQGFGRAQIRIEGGTGNTVRKNVTRCATVNDGIQVTGSSTNVASANVVEQNTSFANAQDGIFVGRITDIDPFHPASDNIIRHNETFNNRFGIHLLETGTGKTTDETETVPGNVVFGNRSHANRLRGIQNARSNENVIEYNHVFTNPVIGIFVLTSTDVTIKNNKVESNGGNGIVLNTSGDNVVTNNRSDSNGGNGVVLNGASGNVVEKNEVFRNAQDGIRLLNDADKNIVQLNHVRRSRLDGIHVVDAASNGNTFERNVIRESGEHDAHDDGTANVWINNKCETEDQPGLCEHPDH
jgi:parallel beta-helix repeat protein